MDNEEYKRILEENGLKVSAELIGYNRPEWAPQHQYHPHYKVNVYVINGKESTCFDFWGSANDNDKLVHGTPEEKKKIMEDAPFDAFNCFISDAMSGDIPSFEEFCNEFGYDNDSRKAEKTYRACQDQLNKLRDVFDGDIYDLANSLER